MNKVFTETGWKDNMYWHVESYSPVCISLQGIIRQKTDILNLTTPTERSEKMHLREVRIDKTDVIEEALKDHLAIVLNGLPGTGRKTAVRMLTEQHPEVNAIYCDTAEIDDCSALSRRVRGKPNWYLIRKPEEGKYPASSSGFRGFIQKMPREDRMLMAVDGRIPDIFLEFIWSGIMAVILPEYLRFTEEETYRCLKMCGSRLSGREVYHMTGGWPGCVAMLIRLADQLGEKWTVWELCTRYEIRQYIRTQILPLLPEEEQELLRERAPFPRLDEELEEILWDDPRRETEDRLFARGAMVFVPDGKYWYVHPAIRLAIGHRLSPEMCEKAVNWYEANGYIQVALGCCRQMGDRRKYRECLLRNYDKVSFLNYEKVWKETDLKIPEFLYLEWMESVLRQDQDRQDQLRRYSEKMWKEVLGKAQGRTKGKDGADLGKLRKKKEILLNMAYTDVGLTAEDWMKMLLETTAPGEKIRLYHMLGESVSFLGGLRDLSALFSCGKEKREEWRILWEDRLAQENQLPWQLAETEYGWQTENETKTEMVPSYDDRTPWQIRLSIMHLTWMRFDGGDEQSQRNARRIIEELAASLEKEETPVCRWNARALHYLAMAKWGEKEKLMEWIRQTGGDIANDSGKTKFYLAAEVKISLYLGDYRRAEELLPELTAYFRRSGSSRWMAESLFQLAIIERERGFGGQALRTVGASLEAAKPHRYVRLYTAYGEKGADLLEKYAGLQPATETGDTAEWIRHIAWEASERRSDSPVPGDEQNSGSAGNRLTATEMLVLQYLEKGYTNPQISAEMNIRLSTVKSHTYNLYRKLEVTSRTRAVQKAREYGII